MALLDGYLLAVPIGYDANVAAITTDFDDGHSGLFDPGVFEFAQQLQGPVTWTAKLSTPRTLTGRVLHSFFNDFYFRIYVDPDPLELGNVATSQAHDVTVWNAWPDQVRTMTAATLADGDGLTVTPPGALPLTFQPLQQHAFEVTVDTDGPPTIDDTLTFTFTGLDAIPVSITGQRLQVWPVMADWGSDVHETLAWLTEIQPAVDASEDREPKREAPRRGWRFDVIEGRVERRLIENAVYDWTGLVWAVPVPGDVELLGAVLPAGSTSIPAATTGLDFAAGGLAMLWGAADAFETVEIASVASNALALVRPTLQAWPAGTRLHPCRAARLTSAPTWRRKNDQVITARVEFEAAEPCDWPALAPTATYLGVPVLEWRSDERDDPTASTPRELELLDGDVGLVSVDDISGLARSQQSHAFVLHGRSERAAHRSLLYWLAGRYQELWLPTWADDVQLLDPLTAAATTWFVAHAGITRHLRQQPGRRHVRVELFDGSVFYRRVTASSVLDPERELLAIDSALGVAIAPGDVRVISWMALKRQASDRIEIAHVNDSHGVAHSSSAFVAVGAHEP